MVVLIRDISSFGDVDRGCMFGSAELLLGYHTWR